MCVFVFLCLSLDNIDATQQKVFKKNIFLLLSDVLFNVLGSDEKSFW